MLFTSFFRFVSGGDGIIYVFKGKWVWRLHQTYGMYPGYPVPSKNYFQDLPSKVGAAVYSRRTRYTYFFRSEYSVFMFEFRVVAKV